MAKCHENRRRRLKRRRRHENRLRKLKRSLCNIYWNGVFLGVSYKPPKITKTFREKEYETWTAELNFSERVRCPDCGGCVFVIDGQSSVTCPECETVYTVTRKET